MAPGRGRSTAAIALSAVAHLVLLAIVAMQAPTLLIPSEPGGPPEPVIPLLLMPRLPPASAAPGARPSEIRLHRRRLRPLPAELPVAPLPAPAAPPPAPRAAAPAALPNRAPLPEGPREQLGLALRRSAIGCANAAAAGLSREEREVCEERFGAGSKAAPLIPAPIAPEIRAYYDAVAKAKAPDGALTPQIARGRAGVFEDVPVGMKGHTPSVGCHVKLGPGGGVVRPAHGLKLGPLPCYVVPPAGSLSPDVDIVNPDTAVHRKPSE